MREFILGIWNYPLTVGELLVFGCLWHLVSTVALEIARKRSLKQSIDESDKILASLKNLSQVLDKKAVPPVSKDQCL